MLTFTASLDQKTERLSERRRNTNVIGLCVEFDMSVYVLVYDTSVCVCVCVCVCVYLCMIQECVCVNEREIDNSIKNDILPCFPPTVEPTFYPRSATSLKMPSLGLSRVV